MKISQTRKKIIILGAGGTGLLMAESILRANAADFIGFLDDNTEKQTNGYYNLPVLGGLNSWREMPDRCLFISSLYGPEKNVVFFERVKSLRIPYLGGQR